MLDASIKSIYEASTIKSGDDRSTGRGIGWRAAVHANGSRIVHRAGILGIMAQMLLCKE